VALGGRRAGASGAATASPAVAAVAAVAAISAGTVTVAMSPVAEALWHRSTPL
jgi:hypothetical protein